MYLQDLSGVVLAKIKNFFQTENSLIEVLSSFSENLNSPQGTK